MADAALTRKAIEEIVRELDDAKYQNHTVERKLNPLGKPNKRFLGRTINSMINHNTREDRRTRAKCRQKLRQLDDRRTKRLRHEFRRRRSKSRRSRSESSHEVYSSLSGESRRGKLKKKKKKKLSKYKRGNGSSSDSSDCSSRKESSRRNSGHSDEQEVEVPHGPIPAVAFGPINQWLMLNQAYLAGAASAQVNNNTCENSNNAELTIRVSSDGDETDEVMQELRVSESSEESTSEKQQHVVECISLGSSNEDSQHSDKTVSQKTKTISSGQIRVQACITLDSETESDESCGSNQSKKTQGQNKNVLAAKKEDAVSTFVDLDTDSGSEQDDPQESACIILDSDTDSESEGSFEEIGDYVMVTSDTDSEPSVENKQSTADKTIGKPEEITNCDNFINCTNDHPDHPTKLGNEEHAAQRLNSDGANNAEKLSVQKSQEPCVPKQTELECNDKEKDDSHSENILSDPKEVPFAKMLSSEADSDNQQLRGEERVANMAVDSNCTGANYAEKASVEFEKPIETYVPKDTELECNKTKKADSQDKQTIENVVADPKEVPFDAQDLGEKEKLAESANMGDDFECIGAKKVKTQDSCVPKITECNESKKEYSQYASNQTIEKPQTPEKRGSSTEAEKEPVKKSIKLDADSEKYRTSDILGIKIKDAEPIE